MKTDNLFDIVSLSFSWGKTRFLSAENIAIGTGECVCLTGPNGSGKTTFLKILNRLLVPDPESIVTFSGEPLESSTTLRKRSVYVHQHPYLVSGSVSSNVAMSCRARKIPKRESAAVVGTALEELGLSGFGHRGRSELSGGETQKVALARALASGADVFLFDEPTSSTDAESTEIVKSLILKLKMKGATILVSTHDTDFAREISDRTLAFDSGRVRELGQ